MTIRYRIKKTAPDGRARPHWLAVPTSAKPMANAVNETPRRRCFSFILLFLSQLRLNTIQSWLFNLKSIWSETPRLAHPILPETCPILSNRTVPHFVGGASRHCPADILMVRGKLLKQLGF